MNVNVDLLRQVDRILVKLASDRQRLDVLQGLEKTLMKRFCRELADPEFAEIFAFDLNTISAIRARIFKLSCASGAK